MDKPYTDKNGETRELDDEFFAKAKRGRPRFLPEQTKEKISIWLDRDILAYYRQTGKGWQSRVNAVLRSQLPDSR
ncbi:BrnA antitoxin family protein [Alphaproteobacteria bacterium LSUCC0684]